MSFLGWLFGSSAEEARAAQARAYAADAQFKLESQRRWATIHAQIAAGWRPCNRQSLEFMALPGTSLGFFNDYPGAYEQIELCRLGERETWVARWDDLSPQMNIVDLWWRPWRGETAPVDGGELKPEEPLALPPPEKQEDAP